MAKGEYMALFNNDAFAEPNWLEEPLKTAESDPKIFAVSSLMSRYYEPELADDAGDYVTILGFACKRGDGLKASRYQKPCRIFSPVAAQDCTENPFWIKLAFLTNCFCLL